MLIAVGSGNLVVGGQHIGRWRRLGHNRRGLAATAIHLNDVGIDGRIILRLRVAVFVGLVLARRQRSGKQVSHGRSGDGSQEAILHVTTATLSAAAPPHARFFSKRIERTWELLLLSFFFYRDFLIQIEGKLIRPLKGREEG